MPCPAIPSGHCGEKSSRPAQVAALRHQYGLDLPLWHQYWNYLVDLADFNFGTTYTGAAVSDSMAIAFPATFRLTTVAFAIEVVLGIGLGVLAGLARSVSSTTW